MTVLAGRDTEGSCKMYTNYVQRFYFRFRVKEAIG